LLVESSEGGGRGVERFLLVEDEETGAEEVVDFLDFDEGFFEVEWDDMRGSEREIVCELDEEKRGKGTSEGENVELAEESSACSAVLLRY